MCKRNSPDKERERQKHKKTRKRKKKKKKETGYVRETPPIKNKPARDV